jgi:plasmid stabilization system protein ParE
MSAGKYVLSRQAVADLNGIAEYLGEISPSAADRVINELKRTFTTLAKSPLIGMQRNDLHQAIRMLTPGKPARSYVVLYYPTDTGVMISDVIHAARDWPNMFARGERWRQTATCRSHAIMSKEYLNQELTELGGRPMGDKLFYECTICGEAVPSMPKNNATCNCYNIMVDLDAGRLAIKSPANVRLFYEA